jgi:hypothetical protein
VKASIANPNTNQHKMKTNIGYAPQRQSAAHINTNTSRERKHARKFRSDQGVLGERLMLSAN